MQNPEAESSLGFFCLWSQLFTDRGFGTEWKYDHPCPLALMFIAKSLLGNAVVMGFLIIFSVSEIVYSLNEPLSYPFFWVTPIF